MFWEAVSAGTIASSSGKATVAPMPRSTVRREIAFLVTIMSVTSLLTRDQRRRAAHLKWIAVHDRQNRSTTIGSHRRRLRA